MHLPRGALRITTVTRWTSGPSGRSLFEGAERGQKVACVCATVANSTSGCTCDLAGALGASPRRDVVGVDRPSRCDRINANTQSRFRALPGFI
jgi:hypothetical protein